MMRISLLQQREPFSQIFEQTMSRYLSEACRQPVSVRWEAGPGMGSQNGSGQRWFCNPYLNAIFPAGALDAVFDPIRREFSRSRSPWLRPLQRAYVWAATSALGAPRLAQSRLRISPAIPGSERWLIVPGNHKIRILDRAGQTATCILKDGFDPSFMRSEIENRRLAEALGLPVPSLLAVDPAGRWFCEQYVCGTPLNRLADPAAASNALEAAFERMEPFYERTRRTLPAASYAASLAAQAMEWIERSRLLEPARREALRSLVERCRGAALAAAGERSIMITQCHGDFQPGNILVDGAALWLIDWEYSRACQAGYDRLVYALDSRHPRGLAGRLCDFVSGDLAPEGTADGWQGRDARRLAAWLFLLEDLLLHLRENANPLFTRLGDGLMLLEREAALILAAKEAYLA